MGSEDAVCKKWADERMYTTPMAQMAIHQKSTYRGRGQEEEEEQQEMEDVLERLS